MIVFCSLMLVCWADRWSICPPVDPFVCQSICLCACPSLYRVQASAWMFLHPCIHVSVHEPMRSSLAASLNLEPARKKGLNHCHVLAEPPSPPGSCKDRTGLRLRGKPASCSQLANICYVTTVRATCPKTCKTCPGTCEDWPVTGFTQKSRGPIPCWRLAPLCMHSTHGTRVRAACRKTCKMCTPTPTPSPTRKSVLGDAALCRNPFLSDPEYMHMHANMHIHVHTNAHTTCACVCAHMYVHSCTCRLA